MIFYPFISTSGNRINVSGCKTGMKRFIQIFFCLTCSFLFGCGILATPSIVTIPNKSLQNVIVVDQETKQPLSGAEVTCQMYEYKNWIKPAPFWGVTSPTNKSQVRVAESQNQEVWSWDAKPQGQGIFFIEPKKKIGWTQIWFPIPWPVGWFLYRTYDGRISASAPGYDTVWISNPVMTKQPALNEEQDNADSQLYFKIEEDQVTIMLPKEKSDGAHPDF